MDTLWLKFSEDGALPDNLTQEEADILRGIYDATNPLSVWTQALDALGLTMEGQMLRIHAGAPYVNWSAITQMLTCGCVQAIRSETATGFSYESGVRLSRLPRLARTQWRIARYVEKKLSPQMPLPQEDVAKLVESTALGLALQSLLLRLPAHTPHMFAQWLAAPQTAPLPVMRTIVQIDAVQRRRTQLSSAWRGLFSSCTDNARENMKAPACFWNEPPTENVSVDDSAQDDAHARVWTGLPVCAGRVTGVAVLVKDVRAVPLFDARAQPIFVFPRARPETVELFPQAAALLFAEGGALSHACTVAREQGIPCVTGVGREFLNVLDARTEKNKELWLTLDGQTGAVELADMHDNG